MLQEIANVLNPKTNQIITVIRENTTSKAKLKLYEENSNKELIKILETDAYIGKNGMTINKKEGDGKTPKGLYYLGLAFGTHDRKDIELDKSIEYIKINKNLYWIDDIYSKHYNQIIDITKVSKDWNSAEHLIEYEKQYEYAIEIKANSRNIPGKRKCNIFTLQCR